MTALIALLSIPSPGQGVWHLGPVPIRGYALCIILGVVAAIWIGERRWVARGGRAGEVRDIAIWAVPFGLVGGRLYHVITDHDLYFGEGGDPVEALYVWRGGLGDLGRDRARRASARCIGCRRHGIKLLPLADALAPGVAGRAGDRALGQLVQPGALRQAHRPAVGAGDRRRATGRAGYDAVRDVPPDVPLRVRCGTSARSALRDLGRPAVPARPRPGVRALRDGLHARPRLDRDTCASTPCELNDVVRPAAQRVDLDRAVRRSRRSTSSVGQRAASRPRGARVRRRARPRADDARRRDEPRRACGATEPAASGRGRADRRAAHVRVP